MKRWTRVAAVMAVCALLCGCFAQTHVVGTGGGSQKLVQRQWFVLWGLVPINQVDSKAMAGGATDYKVRTEHTALDVVIGFFTGLVTVYPRSVTVTK